MPRILIADRLPPWIEVCARDIGGQPCAGILSRPQPKVVRCSKCGGKEPGTVYVKSDRDGTHPRIADTTLGNLLRHLTARRWRLLGWRVGVDVEWRAQPREAASTASPTLEESHG